MENMIRESFEFKTVEAASLSLENMAKENTDLLEIAKKRGILLPSPHLAIFKTIYAKIEEPNKNGVRLEREAVLESLPTLIGKQVNLNHWRKGFIVGHIIDASINEKDQIEVAFVFYKDVYIEDFDRAIEQFKKGDLTVSFELNSNKESREQLKDGTVRLHQIDFAGMGLLLDDEPAYPEAVVFEMAKKVQNRISQYVGADVMFAKEINERCNGILTIAEIEAINKQSIDKDKKVKDKLQGFKLPDLLENKDDLESQKQTNSPENTKDNEQKGSEKQEEGGEKMAKPTVEEINKIKAELGDLCKDWSDEDFANEVKLADARKIVAEIEKEAGEEKAPVESEAKKEEAKEEVKEEKTESKEQKSEEAKETKAEEVKAEETSEKKEEDAKMHQEVKMVQTQTVDVDDNGKEEVKETMERTVKTEFAEEKKAEASESDSKETKKEEAKEEEVKDDSVEKLTKENESLKARITELEKSLEDKTKEYDTLKSSIPQVQKDTITVYDLKKELGDFVKNFTDADFLNPEKVKMARLEKENTELKTASKGKGTTEVVVADTGHKEQEVTEQVKNPAKALIDIRAGEYCAKANRKGTKEEK